MIRGAGCVGADLSRFAIGVGIEADAMRAGVDQARYVAASIVEPSQLERRHHPSDRQRFFLQQPAPLVGVSPGVERRGEGRGCGIRGLAHRCRQHRAIGGIAIADIRRAARMVGPQEAVACVVGVHRLVTCGDAGALAIVRAGECGLAGSSPRHIAGRVVVDHRDARIGLDGLA
jgi:hypothetical protein